MATTNYTQAPPSYRPSSPFRDEEATSPLLGSAQAGPSTGGAIYDQPSAGDLPDDFKYGVSVAESAAEIRQAFIRKVYTILFIQLLSTCVVGGFIRASPSTIMWVLENRWALYVPMIASFVNLFALYWKRHSHPINLVLLSTFTLCEAFTLGVLTAFYQTSMVLQALLITLGIFLGLTIFTFQSKYDFSGMGPWLFGGLMALVMTGFVGIFLPFSHTIDLIYSVGGALIFSGYIVYDTYEINKRLSPDEYIAAAIALYLDFINLFIYILRILNNQSDN
jgi:FtsH-binding integral membrane protein